MLAGIEIYVHDNKSDTRRRSILSKLLMLADKF